MPDDTDTEDFGTFGEGEPGGASGDDTNLDDDVPSYHSGRVRIIGAEPAGDTVREVTGPVVEQHPDLPHWNDAPTGQVPAILKPFRLSRFAELCPVGEKAAAAVSH